MLEDLLITTQTIELNNITYNLEYDHKGYAMLETLTGKGLFKLKDLFINENNLSFQDSIEIVCCACLKHHSEKEIEVLRDYLLGNLGALSNISQPVLYAFMKPLMPPEVISKFKNEIEKESSTVKKKKKSMNG